MSNDRIYTILSRKLSGEATAAELQELDELVTNFPNSQLPVQIIEKFWRTPIENDKEYLEATYHLHAQKLKEKGFDLEENAEPIDSYLSIPAGQKYKRAKLLLIPGILLIFTGLFFLVHPPKNKSTVVSSLPKNPESEVSTKKGSRTRILLPDGTSVWLNGNSKIVYDNRHYGESIREVTLTGEAYFDVVKNTAKPFIIHTIAMDIKVLGTAFNIKSFAAEKTSEASLIRGSIEVTLTRQKNRKLTLKPNEKITVSNAKEIIKSKLMNAVAPEKISYATPVQPVTLAQLKYDTKEKTFKEIAWTENKLMFNNESLESIGMILERWFGQNVEIRNEKLKGLQFTGNFHDESIVQVLQALQTSYNFNFTIEKNVIIIY